MVDTLTSLKNGHKGRCRMGLVKCKASTSVKVNPEVFIDLQIQFLSDIKKVKMMNMPLDLSINWNQTT